MRVVDGARGPRRRARVRHEREAKTGFDAERVYLERLLTGARHLEFQVLADTHGGVVAARRARVLAPASPSEADRRVASPLVGPSSGGAGARRSRGRAEAGYINVGTVEFLMDAEDQGEHYFIEMNTRVQVEHPAEMVTGLDLVEQQIRVAAGEPLALAPEPVAPPRPRDRVPRINAEDPARGFLPAAGRILAYDRPAGRGSPGSTTGIGCRLRGGHRLRLAAGEGDRAWTRPRPRALARLQLRALQVHGPRRHHHHRLSARGCSTTTRSGRAISTPSWWRGAASRPARSATRASRPRPRC